MHRMYGRVPPRPATNEKAPFVKHDGAFPGASRIECGGPLSGTIMSKHRPPELTPLHWCVFLGVACLEHAFPATGHI
jgi:hypothetical protein